MFNSAKSAIYRSTQQKVGVEATAENIKATKRKGQTLDIDDISTGQTYCAGLVIFH